MAQRLGMESLDPFTYNAIRFALGTLFVWVFFVQKKKQGRSIPWLMGTVLFIAASLQQVGMMFTSAGSAGFITGLYVVMVPMLGLFRKQKLHFQIVLAVILAVMGMFFINRPGSLTVSLGNLLVLISAAFFAWHVQLVDYYTKKIETGYLAFSQFAICALYSLAGALIWSLVKDPGYLVSAKFGVDVWHAALPLLYGGLFSVGIAYTLQIKAQKKAEPGKAAVIMCLEGVFALFGGWMILGEEIGLRTIIGASLMLFAMLLSVLPQLFD
ncbi:MAG: EamA family transporter [Candidatus Cloacimonetes bacterium HGW-Cloacimonetes-3]|nr:MAG: EamA family transporter [Candidatus Cloacimonetes bacterium HGW-Cloacimonetes-3]